MSDAAVKTGEPTGIECEGCGAEQRVGDRGWERDEDLDWCPVCWVEYAPDDEEILVAMTRLQAKAAVLCIDTVVKHDTGLTPRSMPEASEAINRALGKRAPVQTQSSLDVRKDEHQAKLLSRIPCPQCRLELARRYPGESEFSPFFIETDIHVLHRPMHPNEVGANHRHRAAREYREWEELSPISRPGRV